MPINRDTVVGVVGAGAMGAGIARVAAAAGHQVLLYDVQPSAALDALAKITGDLTKLVDKGRLSSDDRDAVIGRIAPQKDLTQFATVGLIIEAIVEDRQTKCDMFQMLEGIIPEDAVITTNTSSLSVTSLAATIRNPSRFAGFHFFNPAPIMPLVEVVSALQTAPEVIEALMATATGWGKTPVKVKNSPGLIVNRGARPFYGEALRFLEEGGADAATIDSLLKSAGFRMGPLELIDLVGLDINLAASRSIFDAHFGDPRYKPSALVEERVAAGLLGRKSGSGFYSYLDSSKPDPKLMPRGTTPEVVTVCGDLGPASALTELWKAVGIDVVREDGTGVIYMEHGVLALTDGKMATTLAVESGSDWIAFDLSLDYNATSHIALAPCAGCSTQAVDEATGLFQALGKSVSTVDDLPGMVVARTICMLINEAVESLQRGIATAQDIDLAMIKGLNFPGGPFHWSEQLGADYCLQVLDHMRRTYGEERYRASALLRRTALKTLRDGNNA